MNKFFLVVFHEFIKHLLRPSFIIVTMIAPLTIVLISAMASELGQTVNPMLKSSISSIVNKPTHIGYVDEANLIITATDTFSPTFFYAFVDEKAAQRAVEKDEIEAYYVIPSDYLDSGEVTRFAPQIQLSAGDIDRFAMLLRINLLHEHDSRVAQRIKSIMNLMDLQAVRLDDDGRPVEERYAQGDFESNPALLLIPYGFAMLLYTTTFSSAGLLLHGVVEEKENRVMELLLTSLKPMQLLGGKIAGLGMLGLLQMVIWSSAGFLVLTNQPETLDMLRDVQLPFYVWVLMIPYFIGAYLIYGSLMAGIGATLSSTREGSILISLLIIPVIIPLVFFIFIADNPEGWIATLFGLIPFTASITMIIRLTLVDVAWWQIAASLILLFGTVVASIWAGAKMFRTTNLLSGKKLNLLEIVRAWRAK